MRCQPRCWGHHRHHRTVFRGTRPDFLQRGNKTRQRWRLTISRSRHPFRTAYLCVFTPSSRSCAARTHQCFGVMCFIAHSAQHVHNGTLTDQAGCRWAEPACAFRRTRQSPRGGNTVRGAKGQIFLLYLLGIRYHRLVILHLNKICFIVMPLPRRPPQLRVINRLQNILIYIHKCHQNENYPYMNSFCCWCCLMSFKAFCASER